MEPVRLVCPDCGALYRVRALRLGKGYQCKKCRGELATLTKLRVHCHDCGHTTAARRLDVGSPVKCENCASPAVTVDRSKMPTEDLTEEPDLGADEAPSPPDTRAAAPEPAPPPASEPHLEPPPDAPDPAPKPIQPAAPPPAKSGKRVVKKKLVRRRPLSPAEPQPALSRPPQPLADPSSEVAPVQAEPVSDRIEAPSPPSAPAPSAVSVAPVSVSSAPQPAPAEAEEEADNRPPELRERTARAIRKIIEEAQEPLIEEIARTRAAIPVWVVAIAALPILPLLGYLAYLVVFVIPEHAKLEEKYDKTRKELVQYENLTDEAIAERDAALGKLRPYEVRIEELQHENETLKAGGGEEGELLQRLQRASRNLEKVMEVNRQQREELRKHSVINKAFMQHLRALGRDPEKIARESLGQTQ